jgi:GNAT superfamily N-acetyltransferase
MLLSDGYFDVPAGKIAAIVTSLDMTAPPPRRPDPPAVPWRLDRIERPEPAGYQALFRSVGAEWLWFSRLQLSDAALLAIIGDPSVEIYRLLSDGREAGLLELDFREGGQCELSFFGVVPALIGSGAGRWLMNRALDIAWTRPISRFWVHSCSLDHPAALGFYLRSGFRPFRRQVEIADDPRLSGVLDRAAAAHMPTL